MAAQIFTPAGRPPSLFSLGDGNGCVHWPRCRRASRRRRTRGGPHTERPRSDIEASNVGLITAYRRELAFAENEARDAELRSEIRRCFGLRYLRGGTSRTAGHRAPGRWTSTPTLSSATTTTAGT